MQAQLIRSLSLSRPDCGNRLLRGLSHEDFAALQAVVERVTLPPGSAVSAPRGEMSHIIFPETAIVSIEEPLADGTVVEVAVVGAEGLVGWSALLGCERWSHSSTVRRGGTVLLVPVKVMRDACGGQPELQSTLLLFVQTVIVQMGRAIVSHLQDPVERRLSRWLLMRHDRVGGDELRVTHDEIAANLNVRRASITDALHVLEGDRIVRCVRGSILIRDRVRLEETAGDAYGIAETHYGGLLGPFGKSTASPPRAFTRPMLAH